VTKNYAFDVTLLEDLHALLMVGGLTFERVAEVRAWTARRDGAWAVGVADALAGYAP